MTSPLLCLSQVIETTCIISAAVAVAVTFPTQAEKIFAFTGCTAVCLACYMIPVYIHMKFEARMRQGGGRLQPPYCGPGEASADVLEDNSSGPLSEPLIRRKEAADGGCGGGPGSGVPCPPLSALQQLRRLSGPCVILAVGTGCSAAGLYVAITDMCRAKP